MKLSHRDACRLAAETGYNVRTVLAWAAGKRVSPSTKINCEAVAKGFGLECPAAAPEGPENASEGQGGAHA